MKPFDMQLVLGESQFDCMLSSIAMVTDIDKEYIRTTLCPELTYPFTGHWKKHPKVPSMDEVCDWIWTTTSQGLMPFNRDPGCTCAPGCNVVPVWKDGEAKFKEHLSLGWGLLEGVIDPWVGHGHKASPPSASGHMVAWNSDEVFDPRGYKYPFDKCSEVNFEPVRFWLLIV